MHRHMGWILGLGLTIASGPWWYLGESLPTAWAQQRAGQRTRAEEPRRAAHPKFQDQQVDLFFSDAFQELVGPRPADLGKPPQLAASGGAAGGSQSASGSGSEAAGGGFGWSRLISASTVENEIKAVKLKLDADVDKPTEFRGRGYLLARQHFSVLAMMFAIVSEYDKDVRWKAQAPAARELFARTAANCKVGTAQSFNDAKLRKAELQDLLGGAALEGTAKDAIQWANLVDRSPMMERIKDAHEVRLLPWLASEAEFNAHLDEIQHEAQVMAVVAEILTREGMTDAGDETYDGYARTMQKAAVQIAGSVAEKRYEVARKAAGEISKMCTDCHGTYQ